jgi:uncharacterized membrane protein
MTTDFIIELLFRWMHMFASIAAVGGMIFQRVALVPALGELPDDLRLRLHAAMRARWARVVQGSILFLLVSGLVNVVRIIQNFELAPYYHALFGVKFLLAFGIFFIASMLTGRSDNAQRFQRNARYWLTVNLLLAVLVIGLSGVLKTAPKRPKSDRPPVNTASLASPENPA